MAESLSQDDLRTLLDHSEDIILAVDNTGTISFVNAAVKNMLGYDPGEMVGRNAFEFIYSEDRNTVFERFIDLIEHPGTSTDRIQHQMEHKDGGVIWVESIASNRTGTNLDHYVITTRNIAEIKAREAVLERQNERLDEFASVISHDLRNPLNVARGRIELAAEECDSEHLDSVKRALERMDSFVEDLLNLSRAGKLVGEFEVVELPELADACWANVKTESARLVIDTERSILADESRLKQLLENLFRNAVEHGGGAVTITVGNLPSGFFIADDGPGIPEGERNQVFEVGYSTTDDGTGYGLSIVNQIANAHGWEISLAGSEDGGVRFEFRGVEVK